MEHVTPSHINRGTFLGNDVCGSAPNRSRKLELSWSEWVSLEAAVGALISGANIWRKVPAEASSQWLAWDGRQGARTWASKQTNVRSQEPLTSNASDDYEESSLVREFLF
jgi:hypothetical protein